MVEQRQILLSAEQIQALQTEAFADDVPVPADAANWSEQALREYFESGGEVSPPPPASRAADAAQKAADADTDHFAAAVAMQVIHNFVHYRDRPSTAAKSLGMKRRGDVVRVVARSGLWVRLDDDGWMLTDGRLIGLGALLANHITDLPPNTLWQATRPSAIVETPGDAQPVATLADGASVAVAAECGDWVRLKTGGWVELDAFLAG